MSQDRLDLAAQLGVVPAGLIEERRSLDLAQVDGCQQDLLQTGGSGGVHDVLPSITDRMEMID
jgi:hypothetical protein